MASIQRYIPDDILISKILKRLPIKSLIRFKCVCKTWRYHIESFGFHTTIIFTTNENPTSIYQLIHLHSACPTVIEHPLPSYIVNRGSSSPFIRILGSCNNLFFLDVTTKIITLYHHLIHFYILWDPSNPTAFREFNLSYEGRHVGGIFGFGYNRQRKDYMIIAGFPGRLYHLKRPNLFEFLYIPSINYMQKISSDYAYFNDYLHWIRYPPVGYIINEPTNIIRFDLSNTSWDTSSVSLPHERYKSGFEASGLSVYNGMLGVLMRAREDKKSDLWVMKEYGVHESWSKLFSLPPLEEEPKHLCTSDFKVLLLGRQANCRVLLFDKRSKKLVWYDHEYEENIIEQVKIQGGFEIQDVATSVVSLLSVPQECSATKVNSLRHKKSFRHI